MNKSKPYSISIIHINIRFLQKKFQFTPGFLCLLQNNSDIICLSEFGINQTFLINIDMPNYKLYRDDFPTRTGEVSVYVSKKISVEIMSKLLLDIDEYKNIWLKLIQTDLVIGAIYLHPKNNVTLFLEQLNNKLENLKSRKSIKSVT